MNRTQVKYCGLSTQQDIDAAIECGVDAVGFVFVPKSPRFITAAKALPLAKLAQQAGVQVVALFANQDAQHVAEVVEMVQPDVIQFHGNESAAFCGQFNLPYWKAVPMLAVNNYLEYIKQYPAAKAYLLDAFGQQQSGGSGQSFDWFKFPDLPHKALILAGGIDENNVRQALQITGAKYIDTSSGIEATPGVKSVSKMQSLMQAIRSHDEEQLKTQ